MLSASILASTTAPTNKPTAGRTNQLTAGAELEAVRSDYERDQREDLGPDVVPFPASPRMHTPMGKQGTHAHARAAAADDKEGRK